VTAPGVAAVTGELRDAFKAVHAVEAERGATVTVGVILGRPVVTSATNAGVLDFRKSGSCRECMLCVADSVVERRMLLANGVDDHLGQTSEEGRAEAETTQIILAAEAGHSIACPSGDELGAVTGT